MWHKKALPFYGNAFLYLLGRHGAKRRPQNRRGAAGDGRCGAKRRPRPADGAGTHDAQAGSGIDDDRKARPPPPRAGRRTRLLCGHGICGVGCRHEVRCGAGTAAFLQKGLAKNLQAPLRRGRVLQSDKENVGAKHIAHPQDPGICR